MLSRGGDLKPSVARGIDSPTVTGRQPQVNLHDRYQTDSNSSQGDGSFLS